MLSPSKRFGLTIAVFPPLRPVVHLNFRTVSTSPNSAMFRDCLKSGRNALEATRRNVKFGMNYLNSVSLFQRIEMSNHSENSSEFSGKKHSSILYVTPSKHDMLLPDINYMTFKAVGGMNDIEHLSAGSFPSPAFPVCGNVWGPNRRLMVCLNCQRADMPNAPVINVWFMVHTNCNHTFLSEMTMRKLSNSDSFPTAIPVAIQDSTQVIECNLSHSRFKEANVLGMKAILDLGVSIRMNYDNIFFSLVR